MAARRNVGLAFESKCVFVKLDNILPIKPIPNRIKKTKKFEQIEASIREIGIVEPPIIYRERGKKGKYLLLDGHLR